MPASPPRRRLALPAALLVVAAVAPLWPAAPTASASTVVRKIAVGVTTPGEPWDMTELDRFEADAGRRATVVSFYTGWRDEFSPMALTAIANRGSIPMITWEPWDAAVASVTQPAFRLSTIIRGDWDAYITRWAEGLKAWGGPVWLRFAHEMNGPWYPWSEQVNGNAAGQYAQAWKRVRAIFRSVGVTNATWIWSPNVVDPTTTSLRTLYPGDAEVDWVGVDGFNGGTALPWGGWKNFDDLFAATLSEVRGITRKPIVIAEVGSAEAGGSKATWISDFFSGLNRNPDIVGFVWFNWNKETDWRIQSSEQARRSFANNVARLR